MISPFLIVGCPRSGITLLARMLEQHPDVAILPETEVMRLPLRRVVRHGHRALVDAYLHKRSSSDPPLDRDKLLSIFGRQKCDRANLLRAVMETYAESHAAFVVGEKTPDHVHHAQQLLDAMPDLRVLCMERDGRDVALSLVEADVTHDSLRVHCHRWIDTVADAETCVAVYPDRFRVVRFEDLVGAPERALDEIARFLELDPECRGARAHVRPSPGRQQREPWKTKAAQVPKRSRIDAWRRDASPRQLEIMQGILGEALTRLDYEVCDLPPRSVTDRALSAAAGMLYSTALRTPRDVLSKEAD